MVGDIPAKVKRSWYHGPQHLPQAGDYIGCIRRMGVWCLYRCGRLVPAALGRGMGVCSVHITCKELLPIVLACAVWGRAVQGNTVKCCTDNAAVVSIVNTGRSKDELAMHLMRCLAFFTAHFQLVVWAEHLPGVENSAADALSRDRLSHFRLHVPSAAAQATSIPRELLDMLVHSCPDWTSQLWSSQFCDTLRRV